MAQKRYGLNGSGRRNPLDDYHQSRDNLKDVPATTAEKVPVPITLIARGPYAMFRHPNYLAVVGEIVGMALVVSAPVTGLLSFVGFGWLLTRRMAVEDRALGRQ